MMPRDLPEPWSLIGQPGTDMRFIDEDTWELAADDGRRWVVTASEPDDGDSPLRPAFQSKIEEGLWCMSCHRSTGLRITIFVMAPDLVAKLGDVTWCPDCYAAKLERDYPDGEPV